MMCQTVVVFSLFCLLAIVKNVSSAVETKPSYVLVEYDDKVPTKNTKGDFLIDDRNPVTDIQKDLFPDNQKEPSTDHHYEVPTCAAEDKSKHEMIYSASGDSFKILYACYPVPINQCALKSGNFRNNYCLFDEKPKCGVEGEYEYVIKNVLSKFGSKVKCARKQDNAELYRVGYDFKFAEGDEANVDIYRFCFNKATEKTLYVEYKIISPDLLGTNVDDGLYRRKIETSSFDKLNLGDFTKKKAYYEKANHKPSLLVPTQHMALDWWKAPLFHIVNQQLLRETFHTYVNSIDKYIRDEAKKSLGELFIRAGAFDLADDAFHAYIWWKLIYNEKRTHAIGLIIHNATVPPDRKLCGDKLFCENKGFVGLVPSALKDLIYCCTPDYLVEMFNFPTVGTLDLNELPAEEYQGEKKECRIPIPYKSGPQNGPLAKGQRFGGFLSTMLTNT